jgi:hypothetical protein
VTGQGPPQAGDQRGDDEKTIEKAHGVRLVALSGSDIRAPP